MFLSIVFQLNAQENADVYWISFSDKDNNNYSISQPEEFLSDRAIERRDNQSIQITLEDLPVSDFYLDSLNTLGITVRYTSKWLNGAAIQSTDTDLLDTLQNYGFITEKLLIREVVEPPKNTKTTNENALDYGFSENQITMLNGHILHNQGFTGAGMIIAVLDSGFDVVPELSSFQAMLNEGRVIATRDFVDGDYDVYGHHSHGRAVLSILGGKEEGSLVGSAPDADFMLVRTEDAATEQRIEEYNWIAGAEYADSLGADVISVSLGYKTYDNEAWNHTNDDLDGNTAPISIAATIAASKGMLVVVAAGNEGNNANPKISMPADADSILTIGAVDEFGDYASFSSIGYSFDGRVKPDVVAQGQDTWYQGSTGDFAYGNGTSFSTPIMSGLAACLWQANPDLSVMEILNAIQESASQYDNPDEYLGYGLPDFALANLALKNISYTAFDTEMLLDIYPNPTTNNINIDFYSVDTQSVSISIVNLQGQVLYHATQPVHRTSYKQFSIADVAEFPRGYYIVNIITDNNKYSKAFIKQ